MIILLPSWSQLRSTSLTSSDAGSCPWCGQIRQPACLSHTGARRNAVCASPPSWPWVDRPTRSQLSPATGWPTDWPGIRSGTALGYGWSLMVSFPKNDQVLNLPPSEPSRYYLGEELGRGHIKVHLQTIIVGFVYLSSTFDGLYFWTIKKPLK